MPMAANDAAIHLAQNSQLLRQSGSARQSDALDKPILSSISAAGNNSVSRHTNPPTTISPA